MQDKTLGNVVKTNCWHKTLSDDSSTEGYKPQLYERDLITWVIVLRSEAPGFYQFISDCQKPHILFFNLNCSHYPRAAFYTDSLCMPKPDWRRLACQLTEGKAVLE